MLSDQEKESLRELIKSDPEKARRDARRAFHSWPNVHPKYLEAAHFIADELGVRIERL